MRLIRVLCMTACFLWCAVQARAMYMPDNLPPIADAGGPYVVEIYPPGSPQGGAGLQLDGSRSSDPDYMTGDYIVYYEWDLNGDGVYTEYVSGAMPLVPWDVLVDIFNRAGLYTTGTHTITLAVTDTWGHKSFDYSSLTFVSQVPLPPALALLATGFMGIALGRKRLESRA